MAKKKVFAGKAMNAPNKELISKGPTVKATLSQAETAKLPGYNHYSLLSRPDTNILDLPGEIRNMIFHKYFQTVVEENSIPYDDEEPIVKKSQVTENITFKDNANLNDEEGWRTVILPRGNKYLPLVDHLDYDGLTDYDNNTDSDDHVSYSDHTDYCWRAIRLKRILSEVKPLSPRATKSATKLEESSTARISKIW